MAADRYRPSSGTEGACFMAAFCDTCSKNEACQIVGKTMAVDVDDPSYPDEWTYDPDGVPTCTAYEAIGGKR